MERSNKNVIGQRAQRVYHGWWILSVGTVITTVGSVHSSIVSVFFLPLSRELGLGRAALSFLFSLARIEGGLEGPLVGWMIDRRGPRLPMVIGAVLAGGGLLVLASVNSSWEFALVYVGLVALGFQMGFLQCMHAVANLWFIRYRTRAMSIVSSSVRLGPAMLTPIVAVIVLSRGWRTASVLGGLFVLIFALPLTRLIRRSPESMGLRPDGEGADEVRPDSENPSGTSTSIDSGVAADFEFKEALRTPAFWILAFSTTVRTTMNSAFQVHFVPIFVWKGLTEQGGANMVGLVALTATPFILAVGWLGDRWSKKAILVYGQLAVAISLVVLNFVGGVWALYVFILMFAFGANISPANYSILGEYFGRTAFARLRGILNSLGVIGMGTTVLAGWVFDRTESYSYFISGTTISAALAAIVMLLFLHKPNRNPIM